MKDCFALFLRRIPRFQDLASRLKPRKVADPFVGNNGCLRCEFQIIWYRLFEHICIYTFMLGYHVELHARPNLLTLQCSISCGKILNLWQFKLLLIHLRDGVIYQPLECIRDSVTTSGHPVKTLD